MPCSRTQHGATSGDGKTLSELIELKKRKEIVIIIIITFDDTLYSIMTMQHVA